MVESAVADRYTPGKPGNESLDYEGV